MTKGEVVIEVPPIVLESHDWATEVCFHEVEVLIGLGKLLLGIAEDVLQGGDPVAHVTDQCSAVLPIIRADECVTAKKWKTPARRRMKDVEKIGARTLSAHGFPLPISSCRSRFRVRRSGLSTSGREVDSQCCRGIG